MKRERIELETLAAEFSREGELVVGAVWDDVDGCGGASISLRRVRNHFVVVEESRGTPNAIVLLEKCRDAHALEDWVFELGAFDVLPRIFGDSDAAEWCRRVVRDATADLEAAWREGLCLPDGDWMNDFVLACRCAT